VIVMTSNLGSDIIQSMSTKESDYHRIKDAVMGAVSAHFRPEFINRIDEVVVFHALAAEQIQGIARIQLQRLSERLTEQGMRIVFEDEAMRKLGDIGFDPVYGARPLKRAIQRWVENPLAQKILAGAFASGDTIRVGLKNGELDFSKGK
jgi:ATP-dependent Clp protease ATP-binding subunit ClpB